MTNKNTKRTARILLPIIIFLLCGAVAFGAVVLFSSHVFGGGDVTTSTLGTEANVEFSATTAAADLTFTTGGDSHEFTLSIGNTTSSPLSFLYKLTHDASSDLASAILVHYDGKLLGTLGELCSIGDGNVGSAELGQGFVAASATDASHKLTLELHEATPSSYYDGKTLKITLEAYTTSIDYQKYIFVTNEAEFIRAVDDINSGLLDAPTIVLGSSVTLTKDYELTSLSSIDLNGNSLLLGGKTLTLSGAGTYAIFSSAPPSTADVGTGSITLNGESTVLDISDFYSGSTNVGAEYGKLVTLTSFDSAAATSMLISKLEAELPAFRAGESALLFGANSFFGSSLTVTAEVGTVTGGTINLPDSKVSYVNAITVNGTPYELRVIGSDDAALEEIKSGALAHLPTYEDQKITSDLFLPTAVPEKNATIIWHSSNESTISSTGIISDVVKDNEAVTLHAEIRINDKVYTVDYPFRVSSQNNETKFSYLVAQLSPISLDTVYEINEETSLDNAALAYHYLPGVRDGSPYDYRTGFSTPSARSNPYVWLAYKDIGLTSIEYSVATNYNYVTHEIDANGDSYAYLNTAVFYDYAQIGIKGTFRNGEVYESVVNVTISLGDDSDLQNKVFRFVESELGDVDILANILETRRTEGMLHERGDFYLPPRYMTYTITYEAADKNIIHEIVAPGATDSKGVTNDSDMYLIKVDAEHFYSTDTQIGIIVTIKLESADTGAESRILYFNTPAIIKPDAGGFESLGVFNSIKYQIFQQLTDPDERDGDTGFTLNGSTLVNNTGAYILRRDAEQASTITLKVKGDSQTTDNTEVYTLMRLIEWATGNTKGLPASSVWSGGGSTVSDGQEFLVDSEISVIKSYWRSVTGSDISDTLWNTAFEKAIGRVITNGDVLNETMTKIGFNTERYYKYVEIMNWALDKQDYGMDGLQAGGPPNLGKLYIEYTFNNDGTYTKGTEYGSWWDAKYNQQSYYNEDQSEFISEAEAEIIRAVVLTMAYEIRYTYPNAQSYANDYVRYFDEGVVIPTYVNAGGVGLLAAELYSALGKSGSNFTSEVASLNGYVVPTVPSLDNSLTALQYLTGLTKLYIYGEEPSGTHTGLAAFLTTSGLTGFFNQITASNRNFTHLEMILVARNYVSFDVTFTERLTQLTHLNYSKNSGIKTIGPLVNLPMENLTYLNVAEVDVTFEFSEYVLSNVYAAGGNTADIWYTEDINDITRRYTGGAAVDENLTYLNEADKLQSEYLQLLPSLSTESGSKDIFWRIESGNMMHYITVAGELTSIPAVERYYYCSTSFDSFKAGYIYALNEDGELGYFIEMGPYSTVPDSTFTDEEKANAEDVSGTEETDNNIVETTYDTSTTQDENISRTSNSNRVITITDADGTEHTITYGRGVVCNRRIHKTVVQEITLVRTSGISADKTVVYYDEENGNLIEATYTYLNVTKETQTYRVETVYWYYDFYYTYKETRNGANKDAYLRDTYPDWQNINFNNRNYSRSNYPDTQISQTSTYDENNFTLVPGSQGESVTLTSEEVIISPVGTLDNMEKVNALRTMMTAAINGGAYYRYTDARRTVNYIDSSTTGTSFTYANGTIYTPSVNSAGFITWTVSSAVTDSVGTGGMDSILAEANSHLNDHLYGTYYGMYYAYDGATFTTSLGNTYDKGNIYRLLIGDDGRFYFEHDDIGLLKNTFTVVNAVLADDGLLGASLYATAENYGDIYYYKSSGNTHHYHQPNTFYMITTSQTGEYYPEVIGAINMSVEYDNAQGKYVVRFTNERIYEGGLYGGTGGTHSVVVTAMVKTDDGESLRKFKIEVMG